MASCGGLSIRQTQSKAPPLRLFAASRHIHFFLRRNAFLYQVLRPVWNTFDLWAGRASASWRVATPPTNLATLLFVAFAFILTGCHAASSPAPTPRLAILRFENLSDGTSLDWAGRAFSEILAAELANSASLQVIPSSRIHSFDRVLGPRPLAAPGISTESAAAEAAGATVLGYGTYSVRDGKLEAQLTLEDVRGMRATRVLAVMSPAGDVLGAATQLASQLTAKPAKFGTANTQAIGAYMRALESSDPAVMEVAANLAIAADPDFAPPYRLLAQARAQQQNRAGALAALTQALARGNAIPANERARLELEAAELSGDSEARRNALATLAKLDPDPATWRALGESLMSRHEFHPALDAFQNALALEPDDVGLLNSIGYAAAQAGELETGLKALRRYAELRPHEANPLDSLGDINWIAGRLGEAEDFYLQAAKKDPNFQNHVASLKAAMAHLLTGDASGANNIAERYLRACAESKDPFVDYRRAEWTWISGRRKAAAQQMGAFALHAEDGPLRDVASRAYSEMANWSLMVGDRDLAMRLAQKAISIAGPQSAVNALVARFLAQPSASAVEWEVRANQQFPGPTAAVKNLALAYALLIDKQFQPAQALLRRMWESGSPVNDEGLPVLLAWTDLETGDAKNAAPLLRFNPVPPLTAITPYTTFYIPRLLYLRGVLAEREGRTDDARGWYDKFLALSGPDPLIWGEEQKVRR
jgi:tetratricopeptide (TPR) repeat protein